MRTNNIGGQAFHKSEIFGRQTVFTDKQIRGFFPSRRTVTSSGPSLKDQFIFLHCCCCCWNSENCWWCLQTWAKGWSDKPECLVSQTTCQVIVKKKSGRITDFLISKQSANELNYCSMNEVLQRLLRIGTRFFVPCGNSILSRAGWSCHCTSPQFVGYQTGWGKHCTLASG